jgi:hypothetical protein
MRSVSLSVPQPDLRPILDKIDVRKHITIDPPPRCSVAVKVRMELHRRWVDRRVRHTPVHTGVRE